jgi:hypothetical protein
MLAIEILAMYGIGLGVLNLLTLGLMLFHKIKKD